MASDALCFSHVGFWGDGGRSEDFWEMLERNFSQKVFTHAKGMDELSKKNAIQERGPFFQQQGLTATKSPSLLLIQPRLDPHRVECPSLPAPYLAPHLAALGKPPYFGPKRATSSSNAFRTPSRSERHMPPSPSSGNASPLVARTVLSRDGNVSAGIVPATRMRTASSTCRSWPAALPPP